jgi:hypothetical protein
MAFTSNCDVYLSVNEAGINLVVQHVMCQRPSLFNYATDNVARNPRLLCAQVSAAPAVFARNNPTVTRLPPLPVIGTNPQVGLDYAVQLTRAEVDFSPGNVITLPAELNPPLPAQRIALHVQVCAGLGCPSDDVVGNYRFRHGRNDDRQRGIVVLPAAKLNCFCLDAYAVGDVRISGPANDERIFPNVDGLDIVEISPDAIEDSFLCYVELMLKLGLLADGFSIPNLATTVMGIGVTAAPTPTGPSLPFNPALEDDQLKLFVNVNVTPPPPTVQPCVPSGGGGGGGGGGPTRSIGWGAGPATPPGPNHVILATSARLVGALFAGVRNAFHPCFTPSKNLGPFTARLAAGGHLENGTVTLADDGTISITDLALRWDTLKLNLDVDIPEICVGGFCIIPNPFGGCLVRAPRLCVFGGNPDFTIPLDLSGLVLSRVTATVRPLIRYGVETTRPPTMSDLDAEDAGIPNLWAVFLDPTFLHVEFVDIPDFVANLLQSLVDAAVDNLLGFLPGWAKDLIKSILGGGISLIRTILGIPGDIVTWLSHLLGVDLNLFDLVTTALAQLLLSGTPLVQVEDPFPVVGAQTTPFPLIPVKIPIRDLAVQINSAEMVLQAKVGAA